MPSGKKDSKFAVKFDGARIRNHWMAAFEQACRPAAKAAVVNRIGVALQPPSPKGEDESAFVFNFLSQLQEISKICIEGPFLRTYHAKVID
jgi:hypothetical protein